MWQTNPWDDVEGNTDFTEEKEGWSVGFSFSGDRTASNANAGNEPSSLAPDSFKRKRVTAGADTKTKSSHSKSDSPPLRPEKKVKLERHPDLSSTTRNSASVATTEQHPILTAEEMQWKSITEQLLADAEHNILNQRLVKELEEDLNSPFWSDVRKYRFFNENDEERLLIKYFDNYPFSPFLLYALGMLTGRPWRNLLTHWHAIQEKRKSVSTAEQAKTVLVTMRKILDSLPLDIKEILETHKWMTEAAGTDAITHSDINSLLRDIDTLLEGCLQDVAEEIGVMDPRPKQPTVASPSIFGQAGIEQSASSSSSSSSSSSFSDPQFVGSWETSQTKQKRHDSDGHKKKKEKKEKNSKRRKGKELLGESTKPETSQIHKGNEPIHRAGRISFIGPNRIQCENAYDEEELPNIDWINACRPGPGFNMKLLDPQWLGGCDCEDICNPIGCICNQELLMENAVDAKHPTFAYDERGRVLVDQSVVIRECNMNCTCSSYCLNRVVQNGSKFRLGIFRTEQKGWGVKSLEDISKGAFVCEYVGELLGTKSKELREREKKYAADKLFYIYDIDNLGVDARESISIDATKASNIARFINHSCDPNLGNWQVVVEGTGSVARICFFALREITKDEELTFDYCFKTKLKTKTEKCFCGAKTCKGWLY